MQKSSFSQKIILLYALSMVLAAIIVLSWMLLSPSEPGSSLVFGLSLLRLIIVAGLLVGVVVFAGLFFKAFRDLNWAENFLESWFGGGPSSKVVLWVTATSLGLGWIGWFLPSYRAGSLAPHWNRIQPVMAFILLASIFTLAVFGLKRANFSIRGFHLPGALRLGFILFLISLPILGWTIVSNHESHRLEDFWYGAGVPILVSQWIVAIFAGLVFLKFRNLLWSRHADWMIAILLFVATAVLWASEPLQRSFMFPGPYAPNHVLYPFADAATFDMASQFGLIGQGIYIFNTPFFERTLYISFLIYLHSILGQNYGMLMTVQAIIFAVFPVLVYLIGRSLGMRAVGWVAALFTMFRGANSIAASKWIDLAGPKMILTDFPTAIGIALLILVICEWMKKPNQKWQYLLWVGGIIGLTLMLRTNALIFLVFVPLYALLGYIPQWKNWLVASFLIVVGVIAITLPWELRNASRGAMIYSPIITKFRQVIESRYPSPSSRLQEQENILSLATFQQTKTISSLYSTEGKTTPACKSVACFAPKHFVHTVITSMLIVPTSPMLDDLRHMVKESNPYWRIDWDGTFTFSALCFFVLNIFFTALGISVAWKRQRWSNLAPLAIFVFYNVSNALARTSGGRYIVPVDWIISIYYVIGILFLFTELAAICDIKLHRLFDLEVEEYLSQPRFTFGRIVTVLIILFAIGSLVPLAEKLYPPRYANFNITQALQENETQIKAAGLTMTQINEFLKLPGSELFVGRTLYPRSYKMGQGEIAFSPYTTMQFPRTGFVLVGPTGSEGVVLPGEFPKYFPHAADALVIGCKEKDYTDAVAVVLLDGTRTVYTRSPMSALTCPLKQPVCENNTVCE
jgi:hypothetical protein